MAKTITPPLLTKLIRKPDQKEDTIIFPLLENLGIPHAVSIGPASRNMSERFEPEDAAGVIKRNDLFLSKNGLASLSKGYISVVPGEQEPKIVDITLPTAQTTTVPAEALVTTVPNTPLMHKPADCPTAIIFAIGKNRKKTLAIAHLGRPQVNSKITEQVIDHLTQRYGADPQGIYVGIAPSIGPAHYFLKYLDQEEKHFIDRTYWSNYAYDDELEGEKIIRVDVLGKILDILMSKGIPKQNIEAYGESDAVDTYALAAKTPPESYSYRYSVATHQPERNGRILVAAQLPSA